MHYGTDEQCEREGAPTEVPAEDRTDRENDDFDAAAHDPDCAAVAVMDARHEAIARAWPEASAEVEPGGDPQEEEASDEDEDAQRKPFELGQHPQSDLGARANERDVEDRADSGFLADRDPQQQHDQADDVRDEAEGDSSGERDALTENVPRGDADLGANHERDGKTVEEQSKGKLNYSSSHGCAGSHACIQLRNWTLDKGPIRVFWPHE